MIPRTLNWKVTMNVEKSMSDDDTVTNIYWQRVLDFGIKVITKDVECLSLQNKVSIFEVLP